MRAGRRRLSRDERLAYLILLPALAAVFAIVTIPFVLVIIQSLSTQDGTFVGSINYSRALGNPLLYEAIRSTGVYTLIVLPIEILLGLGFALLVHRTVRRVGLRAAIYVLAIMPLVVPPVAIGVVARLIYAPGSGVLNFSGLQTVPRESVEAAQLDGAGGWAQFRYIDLHYLRPLFVLIIFFRLADVLRVFDHVFILTGGGPGTATQLLSLYMYRVEFKFFDTGQAAALAVVVLVSFSLLYALIARVLPLERA